MTKLAALLLLTGCNITVLAHAGPDGGSGDDVASDAATDTASADGPSCAGGVASPSEISRSLAVTDQSMLTKFTFTRVMQRLIATNGATNQTTKQLYQTWMNTFGATDCTNPNVDPNHYGQACPRTAEAKLATIDPTAANATMTFVPIALFNRFDLAPVDGSNCGEYRIVFALSGSSTFAGRGFIIFEAAMPNPSPPLGIAGCAPIAKFWHDLSEIDDSTARSVALEKFYFTGDAIPGVPAVVDASHYGAPIAGARTAGQIRTNMFIDFQQWQLREFKTSASCAGQNGCKLAIQHTDVAANPANELFAETHPLSAAFRDNFIQQIGALAASEISTISMDTNSQFNEYESVSQPTTNNDVIYAQIATPAFTSAVQNQLTSMGSMLTATQIFNRATSQTCAGCHELSFQAPDLGNGLTMPPSNAFVHVDEAGNMSIALQTEFLPHRQKVLDNFVSCQAVSKRGATGVTVGGSRVGAAN